MKLTIIGMVASTVILAACGDKDSVPEQQKSAAACFNPELYQAGNHYTLQVQNADDRLAFSYHMQGKGQVNGQDVYQQQMQTNTDLSVVGKSMPIYTYFQHVDTANKRVEELGFSVILDGQTAVYQNEPARQLNFQLQPGEQFQQTVTTLEDTPDAKGNSTEFSWTFVGMESLSVPAGTFEVCHFQGELTATTVNGEIKHSKVQQWYAKGLGVPVKMQADDNPAPELVSAEINGQRFPAQ